MLMVSCTIPSMSFTVESLVVGQLQTNCYLLVDDATSKALIIDPGDDADFIIQKVLDARASVEAVVATHGHFDHILAVTELKLAFNAPLLMHSKDTFLLERMRETTRHFAGFDPGPAPTIDKVLDGESSIHFGETQLRIIATPGHTPGSLSFYHEPSHQLWVGDVVFAEGARGRTDFSYCSSKHLTTSINTLFTLPDQTMVYAGHDRNFFIADEKSAHNQTHDATYH